MVAELVLVVLAGLSVVATGLLYRRHWFNPLVAFLYLYVLLFAAYRVGVHTGLFYEISSRAGALYAMAFVLFFMGSVTVTMAARDMLSGAKSKERLIFAFSQRQWRAVYALVKLLVLAWIAGVAYKWWLLFKEYGNPLEMLIVIRQDLINMEFSFPLAISYTTLVGNLAVLNLGVLFGYGKFRRGVVALIGVCCMVMMLDDFTTGARAGFRLFVMLVCSILATLVIRDVRIQLKHVVLGAVAVLCFLLLLSTVVMVRTGWEAAVVEGVVVSSIYGNIAGNVPALSYFIEHRPERVLPGYYVFRGIYVFIDKVLDQLFEGSFLPPFAYDHYNLELYADISPGPYLFNTANDLTYVYWEGGGLGLFIYMYLLGAIASYIFVRAVRWKRIINAQLLAIVMTTVVMNTRGIYFSAIGFWATVVVVALQDAIFDWFQGGRLNAAGAIECKRVVET